MGFLLELHALTLVARSYALLIDTQYCMRLGQISLLLDSSKAVDK